jgi:Pyridoxamine 5'-phosphate oxidase
MPVWGIWHDESLWFSSSVRSRKARNLRADPRCVVTTNNPIEPVVIEGVAEVVRDLGAIAELLSRTNDKYSSDISVEFMDPDVNATFRVRPTGCSASTTRSSPSPRLAGSSRTAVVDDSDLRVFGR